MLTQPYIVSQKTWCLLHWSLSRMAVPKRKRPDGEEGGSSSSVSTPLAEGRPKRRRNDTTLVSLDWDLVMFGGFVTASLSPSMVWVLSVFSVNHKITYFCAVVKFHTNTIHQFQLPSIYSLGFIAGFLFTLQNVITSVIPSLHIASNSPSFLL